MAGTTELAPVLSRETMESPMPVAAMTEEKLPPAPVISSTTPALFRASPADFSKFSRPMNRMLTR